jgi:hypothetical protein
MDESNRIIQQKMVHKGRSVNTKDALNLQFLERVPCIPDSALKSFSPYADDLKSIGTHSSDDSSFEDDDENSMPPPSHYKPQPNKKKCKVVSKLLVTATLSRPRSESPKRDCDMHKNRAMQRIRSLPNFDYGRASYNRGIGMTIHESVVECDKEASRADAAKQGAQFDALLEDFFNGPSLFESPCDVGNHAGAV